MTLLYIALGTFGVIGIIYLILFIYQKKMSKAIKEETKQTFLIYGTLKDEHQKRIFNLNGKNISNHVFPCSYSIRIDD